MPKKKIVHKKPVVRISTSFLKGLIIGIILAIAGTYLTFKLYSPAKLPPTNEASRVKCIGKCGEAASACDDQCSGDQGCIDRCTDDWNRCIYTCRLPQ